MAKVSLPAAGQPMDVSYFRELATAINSVYDDLVAYDTRAVTLLGFKDTQKVQIPLNRTQIEAVTIKIGQNWRGNATQVDEVYNFTKDFKAPPTVTISIVDNEQRAAKSRPYVVVINTVSTEQVHYTVINPFKIGTENDTGTWASIIAIGQAQDGSGK